MFEQYTPEFHKTFYENLKAAGATWISPQSIMDADPHIDLNEAARMLLWYIQHHYVATNEIGEGRHIMLDNSRHIDFVDDNLYDLASEHLSCFDLAVLDYLVLFDDSFVTPASIFKDNLVYMDCFLEFCSTGHSSPFFKEFFGKRFVTMTDLMGGYSTSMKRNILKSIRKLIMYGAAEEQADGRLIAKITSASDMLFMIQVKCDACDEAKEHWYDIYGDLLREMFPEDDTFDDDTFDDE